MSPDISPTASPSSWSDLLPDLLGLVFTRLPFPADRARFRAVCRAWHSAARLHVQQLPWIVFPDGSFGTIGHGGSFYFPAAIIPGLPENVTCLGAPAVGWLALDYTDDVFRRTHHWEPRRDVKHRHTYRLYNPFSGKTVLLPELDSVIGEVAETFEIRKVLMRCPSSSNSPDDELVAVTTNNYNYNVILCRPAKGRREVSNIDVVDVAFHGDRLYGITPKEELVTLDLAENDQGAPIIPKCRRVIKRPLADGEEEAHCCWMYEYDDSRSDDNDDSNDGELEEEEEKEEEEEEEEEEEDEEEENSSQNGEEDSFNGDDLVPSGMDYMWNNAADKPYDIFCTPRHLVQSSCGDGDDKELLMVRHHTQSSPKIGTYYTLGVDILKADMEAGNWVPVSKLAEGEALFLSRSFSKSIHAYGDIKEGFIYHTDVKDVFDTKSRDCSFLRLPRPRQWAGADEKLLTWLFPPELQL